VHEDARNFRKTEGYGAVVAVNVPLGCFLSTVVFSRFWSNISSLM
jgi:hypothetical protein